MPITISSPQCFTVDSSWELKELEKTPSSPSKGTCADRGQAELGCPMVRKSVPLDFQCTLLRLWARGLMGSLHLSKDLLYPKHHGSGQELFIWAEGLMACTCSFLSQEPTGFARYQHYPSSHSHSKRGGCLRGLSSFSTLLGELKELISLSGQLSSLESLAELPGTTLQADAYRT